MCNRFPTSVRPVACYVQVQCCQQLLRAPELSESRSGCPWLPDLIRSMVFVDVKRHVYQSVSELRSCVKAEVTVLGSPSLISPMISVDVKHHVYQSVSELRSCVKAEVAVLESPSLIDRTVSVDVKQRWTRSTDRAQELCESLGDRPY